MSAYDKPVSTTNQHATVVGVTMSKVFGSRGLIPLCTFHLQHERVNVIKVRSKTLQQTPHKIAAFNIHASVPHMHEFLTLSKDLMLLIPHVPLNFLVSDRRCSQHMKRRPPPAWPGYLPGGQTISEGAVGAQNSPPDYIEPTPGLDLHFLPLHCCPCYSCNLSVPAIHRNFSLTAQQHISHTVVGKHKRPLTWPSYLVTSML